MAVDPIVQALRENEWGPNAFIDFQDDSLDEHGLVAFILRRIREEILKRDFDYYWEVEEYLDDRIRDLTGGSE